MKQQQHIGGAASSMQSISSGQIRNFVDLGVFTKLISEDRFSAFLRSAGGNREKAFQLYLWNCELSAAFSMPLHFAEITTRNAILGTLRARLKKTWYQDTLFNSIIEQRYRIQIRDGIDKHSVTNRNLLSDSQIISELSFGFCELKQQ